MVYKHYFDLIRIATAQRSGDSGFESRAGLEMSRWPNGKAPDYGAFFFVSGVVLVIPLSNCFTLSNILFSQISFEMKTKNSKGTNEHINKAKRGR